MLLAMAATVALPLQGFASGGGDGCQPGRAANSRISMVGWSQSNGGQRIGGAYAYFLNYSPWVYPGSSVSVWSMIETGSEWAQVGWVEYSGGVRNDFYEVYTFAHGNVYVNLPAEPINNTTNYNVMYEQHAPGTVTLRITGTSQCNNPYCEYYLPVDFMPDSSQQNSEIHNDADQVPGHYTLPENITGAKIWYSSWVDYNGNMARSWTWMNMSKFSSTHYQSGDASAACHF